MVKVEIKAPVKEFVREEKFLSFSGGTFYCSAPLYISKSCICVNRKLGYLTPKFSVWIPKVLNITQGAQT